MSSAAIPGKLMLSGEYAVLYGAPAALLPVPRWITLSALDEVLPGTALDELPAAARAAAQIPIKRLEEYEASRPLRAVRIDDAQFFAEGSSGQRSKLGLGLSAAEAVGLVALRFEYAGLNWQAHESEVMRSALSAHQSAQGGGSGADVAACAMRRPIVYRAGQPWPELEPYERKAGSAKLACIWSRQSANTRELVAQFTAWVESGGEAVRDRMERLIQSAEALAPLWFTAQQAELFAALDDFNAALRSCTEASGLAYLLPLHARLEQWARRHGGRAKPTGAGGGDMVLLIGDLPLKQLGAEVIEL